MHQLVQERRHLMTKSMQPLSRAPPMTDIENEGTYGASRLSGGRSVQLVGTEIIRSGSCPDGCYET
jgi:hypothetical protein